ncbi:hypothetical protein NM208_g12532 [Fusarium decemcellulare]|uniref:Uncharacterized protein n=1 Tax=Fusarium decemcellulare TaxID=57161 RepID=A0ACC1RQ46_9HYPO|nr:hypothetical protein NM208_g12532 [Fusarium decemcellulare]
MRRCPNPDRRVDPRASHRGLLTRGLCENLQKAVARKPAKSSRRTNQFPGAAPPFRTPRRPRAAQTTTPSDTSQAPTCLAPGSDRGWALQPNNWQTQGHTPLSLRTVDSPTYTPYTYNHLDQYQGLLVSPQEAPSSTPQIDHLQPDPSIMDRTTPPASGGQQNYWNGQPEPLGPGAQTYVSHDHTHLQPATLEPQAPSCHSSDYASLQPATQDFQVGHQWDINTYFDQNPYSEEHWPAHTDAWELLLFKPKDPAGAGAELYVKSTPKLNGAQSPRRAAQELGFEVSDFWQLPPNSYGTAAATSYRGRTPEHFMPISIKSDQGLLQFPRVNLHMLVGPGDPASTHSIITIGNDLLRRVSQDAELGEAPYQPQY